MKLKSLKFLENLLKKLKKNKKKIVLCHGDFDFLHLGHVKHFQAAKEKADEVLKNNSVNAIYSSHIADAGSDQQEMEKNYYMMDRENTFLQYLNRALDMLDAGTFGICTSCGDLINKERLLEVPHTSSCFDCKSKSV